MNLFARVQFITSLFGVLLRIGLDSDHYIRFQSDSFQMESFSILEN